MKKTLIALAAVASTAAFAQSTVTISGVVDIGYQMLNDDTAANLDRNFVAQNGTATTAIILSGSEDLGGGMKANFRYEMNPDFVNGTGLMGATGANGYNFVGVSGGFGDVKFGRLNGPTLAAWGTASVFGTALGSGYITGVYSPAAAGATPANTAPTRFNSAIEYSTPNLSGFTGRLLYVPKTNVASTTNMRAGVTDLGLAYSAGALNVNVAMLNITAGNVAIPAGSAPFNFGLDAGQKVKHNTLSASYAVTGDFTVRAGYWTTKTTGTVTADKNGYVLGARYNMGAISLMASYGRGNDKLVANDDGKIFGLGVDYALSKRSAVYARYQSLDADTSVAGKANTLAVGVRHSF